MVQKKTGQTFKHIRIRRGLTIEDVKSDLHQSAVFHFERHNQDIRLLNLIHILAPTFTSLSEFVSLLGVKADPLKNTMRQIQKLYDNRDVAALKKLLTKIKRTSPLNPPTKLITLVIRSYIKELNDESTLLDESDILFIEEYLLAEGKWYRFEYVVFANLARSLPFSLNLKIVKRMLAKYEAFHLPEYTELLVGALYHLSIDALRQKNHQESVTAVLRLLETYQADMESLKLQQHVTVLRYLFMIVNGDKSAQPKLETLLQATKLVSPKLYAKYLDWIRHLKQDLLPELALSF